MQHKLSEKGEAEIEMNLSLIRDVAAFVRALPKVELHLHLDGAMRPSTLYELAMKKGFPKFPSSVKSASDLASFLEMLDSGNLPEFLDKFRFMTPQISGDPEAIARVAYELCEDKKDEGVAYFETRYAPHLLMSSSCRSPTPSSFPPLSSSSSANSWDLSFDGVVEAVNSGLKAGESKFGVTARSILCCIRGEDGGIWADHVAKAALKYRMDGVVGMDLAGNESLPNGGVTSEIISAFQFAKENQIPITIHAGEAGPATNVKQAVEVLHAQRIGHGYRVLEDPDIYSSIVRQRGIHLEQCPFSSVKTGAFDLAKGWPHHPLATFYKDAVSFSVNTDDPTVTGHELPDEYSNITSDSGMQLPLKCVVKALKDAVEASFIVGEERRQLMASVDERVKTLVVEMSVDEASDFVESREAREASNGKTDNPSSEAQYCRLA